MKNIRNKKGTKLQEHPEEEILEKEIEALIDRDKTKSIIVKKLLNQNNTPILNTDN